LAVPVPRKAQRPSGRAEAEPGGARPFIDFAHLKKQLPMGWRLDQLGLTARRRGQGRQRRCACPLHRGQRFRVNLTANVCSCHDQRGGKQGDVIDLWARVPGRARRAAAVDLVRPFPRDPAP
jgi:hypothetical protein